MNDSLQIAFTALLERYQLPSHQLPDEVADWTDLTKFDERITVIEIGQAGTWPHTNDAIVRFQTQSADEPYTNVDGFQRVNMIDCYCLMADATQKLIIDSEGFTREAGDYGHPTGWVSYDIDVERKPTPAESLHKLLKGETIWSIAKRFGIPAPELIEHNDIDDATKVPEGTILHLPVAKPTKEQPLIKYEVFDKVKLMHTNREEGTSKYSFGNVNKWTDITATGPTYPKGHNVDVVAIARVPIGEDVAAYYLDKAALGDFNETGKVTYTVGFNHSHLDEGYQLKPIVVKPEPIPEPEPVIEPEPKINYSEWKTTYLPFNEPQLYFAESTIMVHDLDGRGASGELLVKKGLKISGKFKKDGVEYLRVQPGAHAYWYGIEEKYLISEDELYNYGLSLVEKKAMAHTVKPGEELFWNFAKAVAKSTKIVEHFSRAKNKKKE